MNWSNGVAAGQFNQRTAAIANIQTVADAEARKVTVRAKILELIGGLPQSNAPLNAQITGSIDMGSYSIQKILFESTPGLIVSTLLYLPKTSGPHPAVVFQIGHFPGGKTYDQTIPGNLAIKGFVVIAFDPIGEGERIQDYNPVTGTGVAGADTSQHFMAGAQSILMGQNFARYELFDAQRAIDYLVSRPEVDATRIGATGCSGGGTLTYYLAALDPRIKVAAPACSIESFQSSYTANGIGDSEQSFAYLLSSGLDETDYVELFAPQPFLILTTSADPFITLNATQIVYDEASKWYSLYGAANRVQWVVGPGGHGTPVELRQAIYGWMIQWLNNNVGDSTEQAITTLPDSQLHASSTGQVGGLQIYQVIRTTPRTQGSRDDLTALLNQKVAHSMQTPAITVNTQTDNGTYKTQSISFTTEPNLTLDALLLIPDAPGLKAGVVFVETTALGSTAATQLAASGRVVIDLLPRGLPSGVDPSSYVGDFSTSTRAFLVGKFLPALRAYDILQGLEILAARADVDISRISGVASGVPGFWMLLAAASDPRFSSIQLDHTPYSFQPALDQPVHYDLHDAAITGYSLKFDIQDVLSAMSPRLVFWTTPTDWLRNVVALSSALSIGSVHSGNFTQGQQSAMYTVTVSNAAGAMMTTGTVTATDTLPAGLTLLSMTGTGWSCTGNTCTRSDSIAGGTSYAPITVTVKVASNAPTPLVNEVTVSGGGSAAANAMDLTIVLANPPVLAISRNKLNFSFNGAAVTSSQSVTVSFTGGAGGTWSASSNESNLSAAPASGQGSGVFQVAVTGGSSGVVTVTSAGAVNSPLQIQVNVLSVSPGSPYGSFDTPPDNTSGIAGAIPVTGWALDNIEVLKVDIWREPVGSEPAGLVYIGDALFVSGARPDVEGLYPNAPLNYRAGWGYLMLTNNLPGQGNGVYRLHAIAHNKSGVSTDLGIRTISCDNAHANKPFGTIDTPGQGGTASGNAYVNFGWALTQNPFVIPKDGSTITVYVDGQPVGHPTYNQFRNDVASQFPGLANSGGPVGFFYLDTTALANGVHTLSWVVYDNAGRGDGVGSRFFNVLNTGLGSVAAPAQEVLSGSAVPRIVEIEELDRLELQVGAKEGYLVVAGERRNLPAGSSLKDGVFYWQTAPGLLGDYNLIMLRPDGAEHRLRVKIRPKRFKKPRSPR